MESLTLRDLLSLTRASHGAWRYFKKDYAFVIRSHIARFYNYYADPTAIPLLELLSRLRLLRPQVKGKSTDVVENHLRPVFDTILSLRFTEIPSRWKSNLPVLVAAMDMIPELRESFLRLRGNNLPNELGKVPYWAKWRFTESFLRFECFCCIFYHPGGFLSQDMWNLRTIFLRPFMAGEALVPSDLSPSDRRTLWGYGRFRWMTWPYGVTEFNFKAPYEFTRWFDELIMSVVISLQRKQARATRRRKKPPPTTEHSEIRDFLKRKGSEHRHFCYHLALQGNMLLAHLSSLNTEGLESYIVDAYTSVVASQPDRKMAYHPDLDEMILIERKWRFQ
ncbi:uracil catabolism 4 [Fusarium denticulatum]|uniref:Uracil catabolism 4 n=1 Tax=Fusarium denticulatum TaxID=48507 RepID=A0A8H5TZK3_9HYPO|nr:uracil catabolism 4 [Fusarium denticulatum]